MQQVPEKYRRDFEIIRETVAQVIKDFNMTGLEITFSGNELLAYQELKEQIASILLELIKNHSSQFQSLLYRVDIDEKYLNKFLGDEHPFSYSEAIAELILQREFQKVLSRKFYSK